MPLTNGVESSSSPQGLTSKYTLDKGNYFFPLVKVPLVKSVHILIDNKKYKLAPKSLVTLKSVYGMPVYFDLFPYHLKLWPIPDKSYELEVEYAG